jgi:hypothetical protein
MTKAKADYHTACKNERSAINQERNASGDTSLSPDQVKKLQERVIKCKEEVAKCREKYDSSLRELTDYNAKYQEDMTDVFEKCQDFEEKRLKFFRETLLSIHSFLDISSDPVLPAIYSEMKSVILSADSNKDLKWWSTNHGAGMPTNWPIFEEYTPDLHNISKKERKIVSQIVHQDSVTLTHVNHTSSSSGLGYVTKQFDSNERSSSGYNSSANQAPQSLHHNNANVVHSVVPAPHSVSHPPNLPLHGVHHHSMSGPGSSSASSSSASSTCHGPTSTIVKNNGNLVHSSSANTTTAPTGKESTTTNGSSNVHHHSLKSVCINESSNKRYNNSSNQHTVVIEQTGNNGKNISSLHSSHHHHHPHNNSHHYLHRTNTGSTSSHENNPFDEDHCDTDWDDYPKDALIDTGEPGIPVRALYDYEGAEADELSFKLGEEFEKLEDEDEQGWCKGRKDGRVGLYPANYVEPIPLPLPVK